MSGIPKRILIADESQNIRDILKANFEVGGYEVLTSADGEETLSMIHTMHPDIVILDVSMPRRNGFQICRQIKSEENFKDIPIIILSSKDQKEDKYWAKDCGADEYLSKPFITSELEKLVKRYIEREKAEEPEKKVSIEEEIKNKKKRKKPFAICQFILNARSSTIFEQKYGEIRYSEMLEKVIETIEKWARDLDKDMVLEQQEENKFILLIEGRKEDIKEKTRQIKNEINDLLRELHDEDDYRHGFIRKNIQTVQEENIPPLSIQTKLTFSEREKSR